MDDGLDTAQLRARHLILRDARPYGRAPQDEDPLLNLILRSGPRSGTRLEGRGR